MFWELVCEILGLPRTGGWWQRRRLEQGVVG